MPTEHPGALDGRSDSLPQVQHGTSQHGWASADKGMLEIPGKRPFSGLSPTVREPRAPPPRSWSVKVPDLGGT